MHVGAIALLIAVASSVLAPSAFAAGGPRRFGKLDDELNRRATSAPGSQTTSVIVRFKGAVPPEFKKYARPGRLDIIDGYVLDVPNDKLKTVAEHASTVFGSFNNTVHAFNFRTGVQSGAFFARRMMGITGAGVGVAVLDSGIAPVDDFKAPGEGEQESDGGRKVYFQDFLVPDANHLAAPNLEVLNCQSPCDDNGHGTHVAGTIAGNGFDSFGEKAGMAPEASIYALRVLGKDGTGSLAGVLGALQWVLEHAEERNIRVANLSFGVAPTGTLGHPDPDPVGTLLHNDPLAVATKKLVDAGIFVVAAAGNIGQIDCAKLPQNLQKPHPTTGKCDVWGGITRPGTYPWVFTAGANSSMGTFIRGDDTRAKFSSRGPAFPLQNAKPDMLAGGVGIESTSAPGSTLYQQADHLGFLLAGSSTSEPFPYMALSGTSQAAAVVSGVAAQMLQANSKLTPNLIKAILEYTSQEYKGYKPLEQGAGFLNALGAVQLSRFYATAHKGQRVPVEPTWSKHFIWGNHELSGGFMLPKANAWAVGVDWGVAKTAESDNIVWGTSCGSADCGDNIVWGTAGGGDNIVWGTADSDNIVWGTSVDGDNIVWGTAAGDDNIVWGTDCGGADCDNIVWGTFDPTDNIVWGTAEPGDNIVWGTAGDGSDNIVWGTAGDGSDNIVWGTATDDNIVWGTASDGDNIVWGTAASGDNIVWGTGGAVGLPVTQADWYRLFLNRGFDAWWVSREFGDRFFFGDGREVSAPTEPIRPRKLPESRREGK